MFAEAGVGVLRRIGVSTSDAEQEVSRVRERLTREPAKFTEQPLIEDGDKTSAQASQVTSF